MEPLFGIRRDGKKRNETEGSRMLFWASEDPVHSAMASSDTGFSAGPKRPSEKDLGRKGLPLALSLDSWPSGHPVTVDWSLLSGLVSTPDRIGIVKGIPMVPL